MNNVTLKKLAKELNLATSTVSRSLRDSHEISEETKERVRALAAKLDFQPNPHASSLRKNKSKTIAVIVPEIQNNFFSQVMSGVEEIAQQKGYHILMYLTHENHQRESEILHLLKNGRVEGVMISVSNSTKSFQHLQAYRQANIPLIFFDRIYEDLDTPCVTTDDMAATLLGTEHLIEAGCKKIAFLSMAEGLSISNRRKSGYKMALAKHGMQNSEVTVECGPDDEANRQKIRALLNSPQRPDGIFASVEKFAVNTYEVCRELNLNIPKQVKVIAFSNLSATALFDPPLSTIVQPAYEIGRESAAVLCKLIEDKKLYPAERNVVLPSELVIRESTRGRRKK